MFRQAKIWMAIGAFGAVVILALGYLFVIKPQQSQTNDLKAQVADQAIQISVKQHKVADLRKQTEHLADYKAALAADQAALPAQDGIPDFLRSMQAIGTKTGVSVTAITVGQPSPATSAGPAGTGTNPAYEAVISLVAAGSADALTAFLQQLQTGQPRAVLITTAGESSSAGGTAGVSLNLTLKVFVAPAK